MAKQAKDLHGSNGPEGRQGHG